ncbi:MAG: class I SAM-dependent methyltransferase [Acidimicrobiales bacterium]
MLETDLLPWLEEVADLGDDVLEIGPGPGLTTDLLRSRTDRVTAVEVDEQLAEALVKRLAGTNVEVVHGDAANTDLATDRFSAATCFSVLHHVPSPTTQDQVLAEIHRVLRPGASLFVTDSRDLEPIREFHHDDVFNPLGEETVVARLETAGFTDIDLQIGDYEIRCRATKAAEDRA